MAKGILSLSDTIDYVFSGESEQTFVDFLRRHRSGNLDRRERIFEGTPCHDLESLPNVDYDEQERHGNAILFVRPVTMDVIPS